MQQFTISVPRTPSRHVQALVATEPSTPRLSESERIAMVQSEIDRSAQMSYPLYRQYLDLSSSLDHFDKLRMLVPGTYVDDTSWGHLGLDELFLRTGARVCGQLANHHGDHSFSPAAMVA